MDASAVLAGLAILVIGENQMANPGYLLNPLHEALRSRGAIVHSLGMCGGFPTRWLDGPPTTCGTAERHGVDAARVNWGETPHRFDLREIVNRLRPSAVVVVIHETLAAYDRPEMDADWARHEVGTLAAYLARESVTCYWVGPGWGDPHKRYHKTPERVRAVADVIQEASRPCRFIDSLSFAAPGDWKTINGRDYTVKGYRAWANAIAETIAQHPPTSMR
jgi:hypothetical protein